MLLGYLTKKSKPTSRVHSKNTSLSLPLQEQAKSPSKKINPEENKKASLIK